jgi:hypothetical protein
VPSEWQHGRISAKSPRVLCGPFLFELNSGSPRDSWPGEAVNRARACERIQHLELVPNTGSFLLEDDSEGLEVLPREMCRMADACRKLEPGEGRGHR